MKLKTLLLGSAAALMAVTGARAADAVVAEPEPVEYVRVCDMYGPGFYYIPGTETCLNFNGYVRVDYTINDNDAAPDTSTWQYRARVNIDARNETDWGTLRSQIRLQADGDADGGTGGDDLVGIDRALISLSTDTGLLRFGYSDNWQTTFHGYGTFNEKYDGYYSYQQAMLLDYTYSANGFSATVGVEDVNYGGGIVNNNNVDINYYAGVGYTGSWGGARVSYVYEDVTDEGFWKASLDLNLIENLAIRGFFLYDGEDTAAASTVAVAAGDYHWGVGARYTFSPEWSADINYSDGDENAGGVQVVPGEFTVGVRWNPVPGLSIRPTAAFRDDDTSSYSLRVYRTW